MDPRHLIEAFGDLAAETADCPRGCTHADGEPDCALDTAVADGRIEPDRLASYRRLLAARYGFIEVFLPGDVAAGAVA